MSRFAGRTYGRKASSKSVLDANATFDDAVAKTTVLKWGATVHTSFRSKANDNVSKRKGSPDTDDPFDFDIDNDDGPSKPKRGAGFKVSSDTSTYSTASSVTSTTCLPPYKSSLAASRASPASDNNSPSVGGGKLLSASNNAVSAMKSKPPVSLADELGFNDNDNELADKPSVDGGLPEKPKKFFSSSRTAASAISATRPNQTKTATSKGVGLNATTKPVATAVPKSASLPVKDYGSKTKTTNSTSAASASVDTLLTVSTRTSPPITSGAAALVKNSTRRIADSTSSSPVTSSYSSLQIPNSSQSSSIMPKKRNVFDDLDSDTDSAYTETDSEKQGAGDTLVRYVANRPRVHDSPGQVKRVEERPSMSSKPVKTAILTGHVVLKRTSGENSTRNMASGDASVVSRKLLHKPSTYQKKAVYNPRIWQRGDDNEGEDDVEEVALVARKPAVREDVIHTNDVVLKRVTTWPPLHQPDLAIAKVKVKVARDTKPLFAVVHNVKKAHECQEYGETEDYDNDLEYIVDGLAASRSSAVRCLSAMNLATKCVQPAFRMHLRAKGSLAHIFSVLRDSAKDSTLALCTATVFYLLSRDRLAFDLDRDLLELLLSLLDCAEVEDNRDTQQATVKVSKLLEQLRATGGRKIGGELETITTSELALETLLSLTSKKSGELFKDDLRVLGGLDHIVNSIVLSVASVDNTWTPEDATDTHPALLKLHKITQCLRVLENVTYQNSANQNYLLSYRNATLVQSLLKCLQVTQAGLPKQRMQQEGGDKVNKDSIAYALYTLLLGSLKVMVNLTHDCSNGSARLGQDRELVVRVLQCLMTLPQYIPFSERFDLSVLGLGLLINLAETSEPNRRLMVAIETDCPFMAGQVAARPRMGCLEALVVLFLAHLEAAHIVELEHDEELEAREQALAQRRGNGGQLELGDGGESSQALHSYEMMRQEQMGGVCRRPRTDMSSTTSQNSDDDTSTDLQVELMPGCQDDEETLARALHKAGRHMEDNIVAAYISLLTGALIQSNPALIDEVRALLPDQSFESMIRALRKFLGFMKFTMAGSSSGSDSIKKIIDVLESC